MVLPVDGFTCGFICGKDAFSRSYNALGNCGKLLFLVRRQRWKLVGHAEKIRYKLSYSRLSTCKYLAYVLNFGPDSKKDSLAPPTEQTSSGFAVKLEELAALTSVQHVTHCNSNPCTFVHLHAIIKSSLNALMMKHVACNKSIILLNHCTNKIMHRQSTDNRFYRRVAIKETSRT